MRPYKRESPIQVEQEVTVDKSGITEAVLFLRGPVNGEVKGPQVFRLLWNHNEKAVINEPNYQKLFSRWTQLRGQMEQAAAKRVPEAEMNALKKKRSDLEKEMNAWKGAAYIYNPQMDIEKLARLQIEAIEIEGPMQKEWPPPSHKALFFAGDKRQDLAYAEEIFTKFLPRAYRRPVSKQESSLRLLWGITPPFCRASKINLLGVATSLKGLDSCGLSDSTALTAPPP